LILNADLVPNLESKNPEKEECAEASPFIGVKQALQHVPIRVTLVGAKALKSINGLNWGPNGYLNNLGLRHRNATFWP